MSRLVSWSSGSNTRPFTAEERAEATAAVERRKADFVAGCPKPCRETIRGLEEDLEASRELLRVNQERHLECDRLIGDLGRMLKGKEAELDAQVKLTHVESVRADAWAAKCAKLEA